MSDSDSSDDEISWAYAVSDTDSDGEQTEAGIWRYVERNNAHVEADGVDALLLEKARDEVDIVVKRLLQRMFGTTQHYVGSISVSRILYT
ncbi:hypothetical protein PR002_g1422 [Phytophthora rubi]|uniref:Uncharacterized protein n=1 Tax=Phytophthora rubi TaxID=129364 RepID=A0A6A3NQH6_9STRA|nr:hypothetical protein PF003_g12516 [Phytophthora fragariae]KAE9046821.1 hypothetical protein PR002_g1422 [Phytophthora rubi]